MQNEFRFCVMGAGHISQKFCAAVALTPGACIAAVASKSRVRAQNFAEQNGIPAAYDSYARMLEQEKPDCVYIGVTTNAHFELTMLCLDHGIPVICEKAMFTNSRDAETVFRRAREQGIFVMEAMWSRFLPASVQVREWISTGRIGRIIMGDMLLCCDMPRDPGNRYFSPELGGGAAYDLTVYPYELMTWWIGQEVQAVSGQAVWHQTGVDETEIVVLNLGDALVSLRTTFMRRAGDRAEIHGENGCIVVPGAHRASECWLYEDGREPVHFVDDRTGNGFVYEVEEAIRCIRAGAVESPVIPHRDTAACARMFDYLAGLKTK